MVFEGYTGQTAAQPALRAVEAPATPPESNTKLYVGLAVAAVAAYYLLNRRK
jgi:hypothetical protein